MLTLPVWDFEVITALYRFSHFVGNTSYISCRGKDLGICGHNNL